MTLEWFARQIASAHQIEEQLVMLAAGVASQKASYKRSPLLYVYEDVMVDTAHGWVTIRLGNDTLIVDILVVLSKSSSSRYPARH